MTKKIACFIHSPASANNIKAVLNSLYDTYEILLYTFHPYAQELFQTSNLYTYEEFPFLFDKTECDLILTGTGSMHPIEREVPFLSKSKGIPCISVLDCFWMDDENLLYRFPHVPDYITAPNDDIKRRLHFLLNIPLNRILNIGIPHFDRLEAFIELEGDSFDKNMVSFFSTCSSNEDFSDTHPEAKTAIGELAKWVEKHREIDIVMVTKHPREEGSWLNDFCSSHDKFCFATIPSWDLLLKSSAVFGLPSALLHEASIIRKPHCMYKNQGDIEFFTFESDVKKVSPLSSFQATDKLELFIKNLLK